VAGHAVLDAGSFRDPDSRVFYAEGAVLRALSERGLQDWRALAATSLFSEATADGRLVGTEEADVSDDLPLLRTDRPAGVLRHERIPFVSYPYEWTPGMLRDAALLQLDLQLAALDEDLTLKDATPYNVQFRGGRPVFVDIGSFEKLREGEPWIGYRQFCELFLYPLMLAAWKDVSYAPWLRGSLEGIEPGQMRNLLGLRDRFRRGTLTHVFLHARLERSYADRGRTGGDVKKELRAAGFNKEILRANVRKMRKLVDRLQWEPPKGVWTEYRAVNSYSDADTEQKVAFISDVAAGEHRGQVWDLGCNDGRFSRICAEHADFVLAVDSDPAPVEILYRKLREEGRTDILPLTLDLIDASPGLGWRGRERRRLEERGAPDLVLCLALLHHVSISGNVPVAEYVDWLRGLDSAIVIEFVRREDPMVKQLLAAKREDTHPDYDEGFFERCLAEAFEVERREVLPSGTRVLYHATPR
jgi:SAM-dependent methyltransferase